ncbi:MAG: S8 family peptidase [Chloroflexota bacterium]|nr:S8 family peptidase [Chloroflexota bacterium]
MLLSLSTPAFASEPPDTVNVIIGIRGQLQRDDQAVVRGIGGSVIDRYPLINACLARVPETAVGQLAADPRVEYVERDSTVQATGTLPWGVDRIDAEIVWGAAEDATSIVPEGNAGDGIKLAVVDSGIDYDHPDLAGNYKGGYDFVNNDSDPMDDEGHGTHCAGIAAAVDNEEGVIGVAPEVELYAVKVLDNSGSGTVSDTIAGIEWAVANGIDILSLSIGSDDYSQAEENACQAAYDAGLLLVAAAGNDGNPAGTGDTVDYPARNSSVIAVAATDAADQRAVWDQNNASATGPTIELAAPGDAIRSTAWNDSYAYGSGTSMACPHVAGVAALVWAAHPEWTNEDVRTALENTAEDLGSPGKDEWYGYGLVNAVASAEPPTFSVTLDASPGVATLTVDGTEYSASDLPKSFSWVEGSSHDCAAPATVSESEGTQYVFTSWSDGVTTPSRTVSDEGTYTAQYKMQHYLTVASEHGSPSGEGWYDVGATATTGAAEETVTADGTRYLFVKWAVDGADQTGNPVSVTMNAPHTAATTYSTQHYLTVASAHGNPSGQDWYDEGATASTGTAESPILDGDTRFIFQHWTLDDAVQSDDSLSVTMDAPHTAATTYRTQHYLTVNSRYGDPTGDGWYDEGTAATVSVTSPVGTIVRKVFTGWSGDLSDDSPSATVVMDSPKTVTAQWRNDYLYLYVLLGGLLVVVVAATLLISRSRSRRTYRRRRAR